MKGRFRFRLSFFLIAVLSIGSGIGISVRYYRALPHHYVQQTRVVDRYLVTGCWQVDCGGADKLVWLLVFADGDLSLSQSGDGVTSMEYAKNFEVPHSDNSVGLWCSGIYRDGKMIENSDQGRVWLYMPTLQTVGVFDLPGEYQQTVSREELQTLEKTRLWQEQLLPAAERESAAFKKQNFEYWRTLPPQNLKGNVPPSKFSSDGS